MTPTTDQKVYTLILPDGRKESWSQEMYDAKNAKLYDKYREAEVYSSQSYNPDSTYSDNAYYQISVDGREPELWTSDMFRQKGAKLREKLPDARIDVITDESTDYWSKRREEAMRRLTDFDTANKAFMSQHERDTIAYRDDAPMFMDEPTYIENDARYTQLAKERENLLYDINNNPLNVNQYRLGTNSAESNIAKYSAIMRKMVNENPDILRYGFKDLEFDKYQKAIKLEEDIAKLYSVDIKNPNDDFAKKFANFVKGHKDTFTDVDFWSRGLTAIDRDLSVRNIFKRLEKQGNNLFEMSAEQIESSLTDGEKALVSAFLRLGQAMSARKDDLAAGYNAGKTSAESLGYMAEFLLSGAIGRAAGTALKGSGKAAQSGLMRYLAKELRGEAGSAVTSAVRRGLLQTATKQGTSKALSAGAKAAINATAKAAGKAYEFVAQPVLQTLRQTPLMPSTYRNIADGLTALDNNGDLVEAGDAIFGQVLDSLIENWSESMGEAVNWGLSLVPRGVTAAGSKVLANTTPAQWAKWIAESGGWRVLKESGFHGLVGEMGEEWLGNAARLGLGLIDQKEWDQFASLNSQLEMAAAFAPMTLIGLGTSSAAIARESKHYAKASEAMKSVLNKHGWTQEEIDNLFGTRKTRAEINEALTPTLQRIVKESVGNPAAAGDYRAVLDFVQAASVKEVLDNVQALERENMRKQESDLIGAELGATTSDDARGKFSYNKLYDTPSGQYEMETVTELKDKLGNISYIVGEDEANYIIRETQDPSTPVIIDKTSFAEKLENGDYEARTMLKDQYLDERISTKQQAVEQQLADESYRELVNAINTQMAPGTPISVNVGDTEAQGVVLSVGRDGVIVDFGAPVDLNGVTLQVHKLSLEQAGRILGVESKQKSQAQIDADQAAEDDLNRETVRNLNNAMRGRQFMQGDELYTYVRVFDAPSVDESGNKVVNVTATNSNGEDVTITMPLDELKALGMDEQSRAELDAANEESGQQVADSHADVERDFRGNEIPMRTNEKTGQREVDKRAFKAADPEAYYRWNDSRRGGDTTDSMEALKADIAAKSEQLAQLQSQKSQETDPDKRDELEESITAITNETNLLSGIYYKYDAASNFKDRQKDYLAKLTDINNRLLNAKTQAQADELLEMRRDALREYYGQMQEAAMTVSNNQWAVSLQEDLNKIADVPVQVVTGANVEEVMIADGASQAAIDKVLDKQAEIERIFVETGKRFAMTGFHNDGKVYIFAEGNPDLESATRSYYHERQHSINQQSDVSVAQIETHFNGDTATMYNALESIIGDARVYADADARTLADELSAFSMELAWTRPDWAEFLKSKGLDEEFINIIGQEYGRQTGTSEDLDNGSGDRVARDSGSGPADNQSDEQAAEGASGNEQLGPAYDGAATEEVGESAEPELTEDQKKALGILNGEMPEQGVSGTEDDSATVNFSITETSSESISDDNSDSAIQEELAEKGLVMDGGVVMSADHSDLKHQLGYLTPNERNTDADLINYSVRTLEPWAENYRKYPDSEERIIRALENLAERMAADELVSGVISQGDYKYGKKDKGSFAGPLRTNIEYIVTFDMDTTCPRTFQYLNYVKQIEKRIGRPLTQTECIQLIEMMRMYGQQIPCVYCYSENKRQAMKQYYTDFMTARQAVLNAETDEEALQYMYGHATTKDAKESNDPAVALTEAAYKVFTQWRAERKSAYNPSIKMLWMQYTNDRNVVLSLLDQLYADGKIKTDNSDEAIAAKVDAELKINDRKAVKVVEDIVSEWKWDAIEGREHSDFTPMDEDEFVIDPRTMALWRDMTAYAKSASQAKSVLKYIPYTDELKNLSQEQKDYINGMGGVRMHSSNDFRIDYVFDYFQFMADMAANKMFGHTYSKSPEFVRIFGNSGYKINMSIAAYEDENGNIRMNEDEGFNWDEAKRLREAFPNAGVMLMATSDNQIQMALDSDWIDMFIPFHSSSLPKAVWYNMRAWQDYSSVQNESFLNGDEMRAALVADGVEVPKKIKATELEKMYLEHFNIKSIIGTTGDKKGKRLKPHFLPGPTVVDGQYVPGHNNDAERYLQLCREYGVRPRFYGVKVKDADGNTIDITEHPNYIKCIKETARTDSPQTAIEFNFDQPSEALDGKTPIEYAFEELQHRAEAEMQAAGAPVRDIYKSLEKDKFGIVPHFIDTIIKHKEETGEDYPIDYITPDSREWYLTERKALEQAYKDVETIPYHRNEYDIEGKPVKLELTEDQQKAIGILNGVKTFKEEGGDIRFSIRTKPAPKNTGIGYKVFYFKDGKLYPPMVANPGGLDTPVGVWLDADAAPQVATSKTGRMKVKAGGKGTQGGSGTLAYRPGWHLGEIPYALQFNRGPKVDNPQGVVGKNGKVIKVGKYFPKNFVWAEVEYAKDVDYQEEAMSYGYNEAGNFQHSLAGLPKVPVDGSYTYRTNANPATDPWIITGAMKVNRILTDSEVDDLVRQAGREPQLREGKEEISRNENGNNEMRFRIVNANQQVFISNALASLDKIPMKSGNAQAWINKIQQAGGLKKEEDKWMGLTDWLKEQKGNISKEDVAEFIREHQVQIEEVKYAEIREVSEFEGLDFLTKEYNELLDMYAEEDDPADYAQNEMEARHGRNFWVHFFVNGEGGIDVAQDSFDTFDEMLTQLEKYDVYPSQDVNPINSIRLDYTTEGLQDKREIALVVPTIEPYKESDDIHFGDAGEGRAVAWIRFGSSKYYIPEYDNFYEFKKRMTEKYFPGTFGYNIPDLSKLTDEERTEYDRLESIKKSVPMNKSRGTVLVIDEIQSKRHQDGKEKSYRSQFNKSELDAARKASRDYGTVLFEKYIKGQHPGEDFLDYATAEEKQKFNELTERVSELVRMEYNGVPDAPFRDSWDALAMKRMLRLAAEEGYDKIAWTSGQMQSDRYNLTKVLGDFYYKPNGDGTYKVSAALNQRRTGYTDYSDLNYDSLTVDRIGEIFGKEIAVKVSEGKGRKGYSHNSESDWITFSGRDLKMANEGMRYFYDQKLVNWMNKYGKKWGVQVADLTLLGLENKEGWHSVDVTPEMKESVMEGQPMFRATEVAGNPSLIAVHNLNEKNLLDAFDLGGFPMPSIAITKSDIGHTNFGEISLVFDKETIDPKNRKNKVFSEDAWTPMFPKIGYKLNYDKTSEIYRRAIDVGALPLFNSSNFNRVNYEDEIDDMQAKSLIDKFKKDYGAKQFFLAEQGNPVREYEMHEVDKYTERQEKRFKDLLDNIGLERLKSALPNLNPEIIREVKRIVDVNDNVEDSAFSRVARRFVLNAIDYATNGNKQSEVDLDSTKRKIDERIDQGAFEKWIEDMFSGIVENRGIRNEVEPYTSIGNRRAWEKLYDEVTLDNVVKAMSKKPKRGGSGFFGGNIFGAAAKTYNSISDIRKDAAIRLAAVKPEEIDKQKQAILDRLSKVKVTNRELSISEMFDLTENIKDAVAKSHTAEGIHRYLKDYYPDITMEAAQEIADIVKDIQSLSTKYFEAKPYRAVGFDEVKLAVVPEDASQTVVDGLKERGVPVRTYENSNQQERMDIISNATEEMGLRFRTVEITPEVRKEMDDIISKAKENGTYLKAPNGADTKLTPEQWAMVRTSAFKNWFGLWENDPENASKALDENGEPRVFYHGTNWDALNEPKGGATFDIRNLGTASGDAGFFGSGHYFAFTKAEAGFYGRNMIEAFLNLRNPFYYNEAFTNYNGKYLGSLNPARESMEFINLGKLFPEIAKDYEADAYEGREHVTSFNVQEYAEKFDEVYNNKKFIVEEDKNYPSDRVVVKADPITIQHENGYTWTEYGYQKTIAKPSSEEGYDIQAELTHWYLTEPSDNTPYLDDAKVIEGIYEPHVEYKLPNLHYAFEGNAFSEAVKAKGYDGVFQSAVGDEAVAFEPNQIKSATDNTGEFSRENDDIRFRVEFTPSEIASMETPILFSKGTFKNLEEAEKWAMQNLSGRGETNMFTGELVTISRKSIREMLAPKFSKKVGEEVHMSALMSVLDFIKTGIPAEAHPDTHGRGFDVIRLYNAFSNNEKIYRVKSTIKRLKEGDRYYTYEMQEMELIEDMQNALGLNSNPVLNSTDSISGAKLLKGVKKTNSNETILSFRITPAQDAEYMSAVEAGDMETADRMVRDAFISAFPDTKVVDENGNPIKLLHLSESKHTIFGLGINPNVQSLGFFTDDHAQPEDYANKYWREAVRYNSFLNLQNPLIIDFAGSEFYEPKGEATKYGADTDNIVARVKSGEFGEYDGVIMKNVGGEFAGNFKEPINDYVPFYPSQIKSADPVTYDDNGNIIPLSQRFNPESNDIRFRTIQQTPPEVGFREATIRSRMFTGNMARSDVFDTMMDVYAALPEEVRQDIVRLAPVNGYNLADATARFFSDIASREDMSEKDIELVSILRDTIEKRHGDMGLSLQDALWIVYNNTNKADDFVSLARHTMVASRLGHMPKDELDKKEIENGVNFSIIESARSSSAAYMYNESTAFWGNRLKESYVDMFESVNDLVAAIETATGSKAQSFEDIRLALNQQSSKGLDRMNDYIEKYMKPMWDAIGDLAQYGQHYGDVVLYVMYKHGIERNDVLARRDAKRFYKEQLDNILAELNKQKQQAENELKNATTQSEKDAAQIKLDDLQSQIDSANQSYDRHIKMTDNGTSAKYKEFREQDYSGIMAMHYHYEGLLPRESYRSERDYQAARLQATKPDYDNLADAEAASLDYINAFESSVGKDAIDNLWEKINAATKKTLEDQYKSNMLSKQQYDHIKGMFNYYVPLRGFDDVTAQDIWQYYNVGKEGAFTPAVLAAKGRKSKAEEPFKWIGTMASSAIAQDVKNESKLALYYFVANRPNQDLVSIRDVWYEYDDAATLAYQAQNPGSKRRIFSAAYPAFNESLAGDAAKQAYDTWEESMKQKAKQGLAYRSSNNLGVKDDVAFISKPEQEQHVIRMNLRGKRVELYVNGDPRAAQAINGVFNVERKEGYENIFGPVLRLMSAVNTSYNPEFWISNAQRDLLFSFMASDIKGDGAFKFLSSLTSPVKIMRMMKDYKAGTLGNSPLETYYREFAEGGAITGFTVVKGNEVWEKEIKSYLEPSMAKRVLEATRIDKFLGFFHNLGEAVEQMCRFAAFVNARERGKDITEAVNDAKEISVNFNRKGSGQSLTMEEIDRLTTKDGKELNYAQKLAVFIASLVPAYGRRLVMFFNAAVQGLNAVYKLWTKDKRRTMAWAAGYFAVGAITAMLHAMLDDDDDYLDMPDYTRRNNLLIGGGGIYLKWALPQEARMFYAMGDMAVGHAMGRYPHKNMLGEMANAIADVMPLSSTSGVKGLAPSFVQPILDIAENKDFTGGRIYNDLKYLSDAEKKATPRYSVALKGTDMVFVGISEALNFFSGGNQYEAGMINIPPEIIQHVTESIGGGLFRTVDKTVSTAANAVGAAIGNEDAKELFSIRRFPFLNRVLELNDERTRNSHITDVYYYYSDEVKKAKNVLSRMKKSKDKEALEKYKETDSYKIYEIFEKHKKQIKKYDEALKVETSAKNRKRLMREQDELRRKIIEEISYID